MAKSNNPIDDKIERITKVIFRSKYFLKMLVVVFSILFLVGLIFIFEGIYFYSSSAGNTRTIEISVGLGLSICLLLLLIATFNKLKSLK